MAKVVTFMYCESSQNEMTPQGPKLHIINPMLVLTPAFIPGMFSFGVTIGVMDIDIEATHTLKFILKSPIEGEKNVVDTGDITLSIPKPAIDLPKDMHGLTMGMDFRNAPLKYEGEYTGEVYFDGVLIGEYPIKAKAVDK